MHVERSEESESASCEGEISPANRSSANLEGLGGAATYPAPVDSPSHSHFPSPLAPCGSRRFGQVNEIGENVNRFPLLGIEHIWFATVVIILQV